MRDADHAALERVAWKGDAAKLAISGDGGNSHPIDERLTEIEQRTVDQNEDRMLRELKSRVITL